MKKVCFELCWEKKGQSAFVNSYFEDNEIYIDEHQKRKSKLLFL